MKIDKILLTTIILSTSSFAHAEVSLDSLPGIILKILGIASYVYAWQFLYLSLGLIALIIILLFIFSRFDNAEATWPRTNFGSGLRSAIDVSIVISLVVFAGCSIVILIGLSVGLKPMNWADVSKALGHDKPAVKVYRKSRQEIKEEHDAIPKVKDDLSWKKYSPLKRPWPEYEGALYKIDDTLRPAPYSIEVFIGGLPRKSKLIKLCELDYSGPCDGQVAYMLNSTNFVFTKLFKGKYALHILDLQTGQAIESRPFLISNKWEQRRHIDLTNIQLDGDSFYKKIPLEQF